MTTDLRTLPHPRRPTSRAVPAVVAPALFLLTGGVLSAADHEALAAWGWDVADHHGVPWPSSLALLPGGWLKTVAFAGTGAALIALATALPARRPRAEPVDLRGGAGRGRLPARPPGGDPVVARVLDAVVAGRVHAGGFAVAGVAGVVAIGASRRRADLALAGLLLGVAVARRDAGLVRVPRRLLLLGHRIGGTDPRERTGAPHRSRVGTSKRDCSRRVDCGRTTRSTGAGRAGDLRRGHPARGVSVRRLSLLLILTILWALLSMPTPRWRPAASERCRSTRTPCARAGRRREPSTSAFADAGPTVVRFFSSDPSVAQVPVSITIPAGQTTGTFTITSNAAAPPTIVQIMGATPDNISRTHNLSVNAATPAGPSLSSVSFVPTSIVGGQNATGTVRFSGP